MKLPPLFALILLLRASCVMAQQPAPPATPSATPPTATETQGTPPSNPEDRPENHIVGVWRGAGWGVAMVWVFDKNHTWSQADDRDTSGTWSFKDGKFLVNLPDAEADLQGIIDARGQLVLQHVTAEPGGEGEMKYVFRHESSGRPPAIAPAGEATTPTTQTLLGEWRFAYARNTLLPLAPAYDVVSFTDQGTVLTTSTLAGKAIAGKYKLTGNILSLTGMGANRESYDLACRLEEGGKALVLASQRLPGALQISTAEWFFLRPEGFLPNDLAGAWVSPDPAKGVTQEMTLRPDGRYSHTITDKTGETQTALDGQRANYCRFWPCKFGKAMTMVSINPEVGRPSNMMRYERQDGELILTPLAWTDEGELKLQEEGRAVWKLEGSAPEKNAVRP